MKRFGDLLEWVKEI